MPKAPLSLFVLALAAAFAAACARPAMGVFPVESQPKMAAVRHWDVLAGEVADKVKKALDANPEVALTPIDVAPECSDPFCSVFGQLVASELVSRGLQVASRPEGVMALRFRSQVVSPVVEKPKAKAETTTGITSRPAVSLAKDDAPKYPSDTLEVAVTSELVYQNRFLVHHTGVYYVDAADVALYGRPLPLGKPGMAPGETEGRSMRITGE